ncbi:N-terminal acetyltransferase B complex auxiliary subunit NAA25 [Oryza brachyantha]|uniref:N-acetyltransferase domain-containing protein n=1 Tax=Oryza brachyantha TaxID=4533 RepID=J3M644_ORYBR|nr:N-terminal acetyltransferase B complex auxiliary subunit NAA25 [Oryza brachyantha]
MASKFGLAGGIPERRVRPIWDAVDSRQYKAALKLCTALLAKHPTSPYVLALKGLILERMGKPDEALSVCLNAKELLCSDNIFHFDDLTLSTLQIVFQRLERLDLATSCYEYACTKYPNNLELMMGLFNCYVREYSYVKQQQTAIKMYKTVGEERFLLWAVCSIQLQVRFSSGGEKLLPLAEALLKKHITSHSLHEPEALALYISILEQQSKYDAALEVLSGDLGSLMGREEEKLRLQGRLLAQACNYAAASEIYQKILESCPDDWESFLHYLGCLLEHGLNLPKSRASEHTSLLSVDSPLALKTSLSKELVESRLANALSFVQKLQGNDTSECVRGPHLANIEIERQRRLSGNSTDRNFFEALVNYFHRFGHLSCAPSDVEIYLHMLSNDEITELLDTISRSFDTSSLSVKGLGLTITSFKVQELLGIFFSKSTTELQSIAKGMVETFYKSLPLSRDLDPQESMHGEELLCMASSILVQLFWRTRNLGYLIEAILVLEFGLTVRKYVWQYKVILVHLYSYLGALPLAYRWYVTLEVKNILLESASHHILPQMLSSPLLQQTADLVKDYLKFMDDHLKESADLTCLAYRHRTYSKVIEFVQFKERLQHSMQYLSMRSDSIILSLKQKAESLEEVESIIENVNHGSRLVELSNRDNMEQFTFNEDLQARPWWTPTTNVNFLSEPFDEGSSPACFRAKVFEHKSIEKDDPKIKDAERKSLLPRIVYLSMHGCASSFRETEPNGSGLGTDAAEMKPLLEKYARSIGYSIDDALSVILGMSSGKKSVKDFAPDIVSWMSFAVFINAWNLWSNESVIPKADQSSPSSWQIVDSLVKICIEQLIDANRTLTSPGNSIPVLVQMITEPISWHLLVIQSCVRSMAPQGKKKKKGGPSERPNIPRLQATQRSVQCMIETLRSVQSWLSDQTRPEEQALDILMSYLQGGSDDGPGQIPCILEENSARHNPELGERFAQSLETWSSAGVIRRIVGAEKELLVELKKICDSKLKLLGSVSASLSSALH